MAEQKTEGAYRIDTLPPPKRSGSPKNALVYIQ